MRPHLLAVPDGPLVGDYGRAYWCLHEIDVSEDRIMGSARDVVGKAEHGWCDAIDSDKLESNGCVDQAAGTIQHGYGVIKKADAGAVHDAPGAVGGAHLIAAANSVAGATRLCASGSATTARSTSSPVRS